MRRAGIIATGSRVPTHFVTTDELALWPGIDRTADRIRDLTGINTRGFAESDETTSDYAVDAAHKALAAAKLSASEIDLIILATTTPDYHCPATAVAVQYRLGAKCAAYDIKAGCSGFGFALAAANAEVIGGMSERVLVIGADLLSRIVNPQDRGTAILLADGAGAVIVTPVADNLGMEAFVRGTDGEGADKLIIPSGGVARPLTAESLANHEDKLFMAGRDVFKFAVKIVPGMVRELVGKLGIGLEQVDMFVLHQANLRIIQSVADRLELPMDRFFVNVDRVGNTSAASIPIALDECVRRGLVARGDRVLIAAFGAGLTWAGCSMKCAN